MALRSAAASGKEHVVPYDKEVVVADRRDDLLGRIDEVKRALGGAPTLSTVMQETAVIEALENEDPLAWPSFATEDDVRGLPPTVISVNECDPLRDEGIAFYRTLLRAGVPAQCRQVMGTIHATEIFQMACPDISRETAASLAQFARDA